MGIEFKKVSEFPRGTIFDLLTDAYSFYAMILLNILNCAKLTPRFSQEQGW